MRTLSRFTFAACLTLISTACGSRDEKKAAPILLFDGTGTSPGDVAAVKAVLERRRLDYSTVGSWGLNRASESDMRKHRLLIVPGGDFVKIGNGLTADATTNIRNAVRGGLNYFGICAGAFFAGDSPYNGLNLTSGVRFGFYAAESQGIHKTAVAIATPGAPPLDQYWEDGPQLTGWGTVAGTYPDRTAAIVQGAFGSGWVVLSGVHPEAPAAWRRGMIFKTPAGPDNAYAGTLIDAALSGAALPHY
jgi:hypothetical protein